MSTAPYTVSYAAVERPAVFVVGFAVCDATKTKYAGRVKFDNSPLRTITRPHQIPIGATGVYGFCLTHSDKVAIESVCNQVKPPAHFVGFTSENHLLRLLAEQFGEEIPPEEPVIEYAADIPPATERPKSVPLFGRGRPKADSNDDDEEEDEEDEDPDGERDELEALLKAELPSETSTVDTTGLSPELARIRTLKCWSGTLTAWIRDSMEYPCVPADEARRLVAEAQKAGRKATWQSVYVGIRKLLDRAELPY